MEKFKDFTLSEAKLKIQEKIEQEIMSFFRKGTNPRLVPENELKNYGYGNKTLGVVEVRHWGKWKVPDGEYDDEDYDWEVLDDKSAKMLHTFIQKMDKKSSKLKVTWSQEEKNWIIVTISKK